MLSVTIIKLIRNQRSTNTIQILKVEHKNNNAVEG